MLSKDDALSISWLGSFGRRLPDFVDTNLPSPTPVVFRVKDANQNGPLPNGSTITANTFLGSRPNPNFADSSFTWSHALGYGENNTTGAAATALLDPTNIRLDYGNSNQNVPDRFIVYVVADSPWHIHGPLGYLVNDFEMSPDLQVQWVCPIR